MKLWDFRELARKGDTASHWFYLSLEMCTLETQPPGCEEIQQPDD